MEDWLVPLQSAQNIKIKWTICNLIGKYGRAVSSRACQPPIVSVLPFWVSSSSTEKQDAQYEAKDALMDLQSQPF